MRATRPRGTLTLTGVSRRPIGCTFPVRTVYRLQVDAVRAGVAGLGARDDLGAVPELEDDPHSGGVARLIVEADGLDRTAHDDSAQTRDLLRVRRLTRPRCPSPWSTP